MSIQKFIDKLEGSNVYKEFKNKHKDNYMTAGFFILDLESGNNVNQLDFYVPSEKKVAAFTLGKEINLQMLDMITEKLPEKLEKKSKIDLDALPGILEDEMKNRSITEEIKKVIAVLQCIGGKKIWNVSCILSGMEILRAHVEDESETVLKMERTSMMDIMKAVPKSQLLAMQGKAGRAGAASLSKADVKTELDKLNKLEEAIEKEKKELEKISEGKEKPGKAPKAEKIVEDKQVAKKAKKTAK